MNKLGLKEIIDSQRADIDQKLLLIIDTVSDRTNNLLEIITDIRYELIRRISGMNDNDNALLVSALTLVTTSEREELKDRGANKGTILYNKELLLQYLSNSGNDLSEVAILKLLEISSVLERKTVVELVVNREAEVPDTLSLAA